MIVSMEDKRLKFSGRIDWTNAKKPEFVFPATSLHFRFYGKKAVLTVGNRGGSGWRYYAGMVVDGEQSCRELFYQGRTRVVLVDEPEEKEHDVLFFKRVDSCHEMILEELELSPGSRLLEPPGRQKRRLEFYGDSVSAGEVSEAVGYAGKEDPEHKGEFTNSWYSFAWMTARKLKAEIHDVAQGGIALLDYTGWFREPNQTGMESVWDKIHYNPDISAPTQWDFSKYVPQAVVVALGQNDSHPLNYMKEDYEGEKAALWRKRYEEFLKKIRGKYPRAHIVCCTTILIHDLAWDKAIDEVCRRMGDDRVTHYMFRRNGTGTPGHPRITEADEMAGELADYLDSLHIEGWD